LRGDEGSGQRRAGYGGRADKLIARSNMPTRNNRSLEAAKEGSHLCVALNTPEETIVKAR
jgi:hypothetical protein